jgi:hypothetical protein
MIIRYGPEVISNVNGLAMENCSLRAGAEY